MSVKVLMTESKGDYSNYAFVDHSLDNIPQIQMIVVLSYEKETGYLLGNIAGVSWATLHACNAEKYDMLTYRPYFLFGGTI